MLFDFPKAIPEPRGCGEREEGGVYAESGLSDRGKPIEHFLFDPPLPLPEGIDLVNKPQLWQRVDPESGELAQDTLTGKPIYDLLIWIGAEHYPYAPDYIEETRRLGASRRLNPNLDLTVLTRQSRMLLAHPRAILPCWHELIPPEKCRKENLFKTKGLPYHDLAFYEALYRDLLAPGEVLDPTHDDERLGPCIFKLWEMLPEDEALDIFEQPEKLPLCLRQISSTVYEYRPTGEETNCWEPGFVMALPITGIALIQHRDGSVNERAKEKLQAGAEQNGEKALPFYETDK
jgi:hypothetical protein